MEHAALQHHDQQQQTQAAADNAAAEAELGEDILDPGSTPSAQPSPGSQAEVAPANPAGPADEDDLYADLAPVIPQTDGAADSPPRHRLYSSRADPGERWEMGAGRSGSDGLGAGPVLPWGCGNLICAVAG